ncbi:uncharacterized protein LOC111412653 [Olea europaea var. sylvestris]|uniref:uncharacterized protein LOC111412653 n=1 Tax=Olea europaea var. sylvestris TaxID=158386 RepID=UPI000C1D6B5E|nr:uncharacterized protein LOC111412653 [Olea europaea var. sylvestris]
MTDPLFRFTGDSIIPRGWITLPIEMGSAPLVAQHFMKFLVIDHRSAYHGALGRPVLKDLWAITSIHYLCMKFPTKHRIATVRGDQMGSRACYLSSLQKSEARTVNVILTEVPAEISTDVEMLNAPKQGHTSEQEGDVDMEEKHEDMVGINPRISCHHLNINPSYALHRQKRRAHNPERYEALKDEVNKLSHSGLIREAIYPRKKFQWTSECEEAFEALKKYLGETPLLSKPQPNESLLLTCGFESGGQRRPNQRRK